MKNNKPRAYIPIYAFAVTFVVCAFFMPMYTLTGLAGSAAISVAAAVAAYYTAAMLLKKKAASMPEPEPEPVKKDEPKLSPEVQAIIERRQAGHEGEGRSITSIKNNETCKRIKRADARLGQDSAGRH